jgi:hypothetical protein
LTDEKKGKTILTRGGKKMKLTIQTEIEVGIDKARKVEG